MQQALGFGLVLFKIGLFLLRLGPSHRREGFQVLAMPCTDVASTCLMLATPSYSMLAIVTTQYRLKAVHSGRKVLHGSPEDSLVLESG